MNPTRFLLISAACAGVPFPTIAQSGAPDGEWPYYGADAAMTRYSPLDQIDAENVNDLELVWRWNAPDPAIAKENPRARVGYFKSTPLMVDGILYVSTPTNTVAAVNARTGETVWHHDPKAYERSRRVFQHRGVAYWREGDDARIVVATAGRQLIALDGETGEPVSTFGDGGWVDLETGLDTDFNTAQISFSAPPMIVRDTIVLGCLLRDEASNPDVMPGHIRGFDVRTGKQKWIFWTIPRAGEPGYETWDPDTIYMAGAANNWTMMSADPELGLLYVPTGTPANDFYGGHRLGDNLFAESVICLDVETGERVWHFQGVHHGLWDYDFPAAPIVLDITVDGEPVKALAQVSKQGFTYVFHRDSGEPVWPIEERQVPTSDVPGETASPTQPFPTKPPPFERQGISEDDLIDFTAPLRQEAVDYVADYRMGPLFTPPALTNRDGTGGTIQLPGAAGGANWGSAGVDPENGILFVQSATQPSLAGLIAPPEGRSQFKFIRGGPWMVPNRESGLPLTKPPYGRVTAIDLNKGEILWQVPHGDGPRDHPLLKHLNLPPLGAPSNTFLSNSGVVVTKTMAIYSHVEVLPEGGYHPDKWWLIAYDKLTGGVLWKEKLPLPPFAVPMTYMHEGKQYIAVACGGSGHDPALLAYALP